MGRAPTRALTSRALIVMAQPFFADRTRDCNPEPPNLTPPAMRPGVTPKIVRYIDIQSVLREDHLIGFLDWCYPFCASSLRKTGSKAVY
jgi:hypothetical protein